jgi:NADP-dependent aldehyde dehydrogenase
MGSVNPIFVLPDAIRTRGKEIAEGLAQSVTLGVGQFCTNPGLVVTIGPDDGKFVEMLADYISKVPPGYMLTPGASFISFS